MGTSAQPAPPDTTTDPSVREHVFLVVLEPGPPWLEGKPLAEQPLRERGRYLLDRGDGGEVDGDEHRYVFEYTLPEDRGSR